MSLHMDLVGEWVGRIHPARPHMQDPARTRLRRDTVHVLCVPATHRGERHVKVPRSQSALAATERAGSGRICVREDARVYCAGEASARTAMRAGGSLYCPSTPIAQPQTRVECSARGSVCAQSLTIAKRASASRRRAPQRTRAWNSINWRFAPVARRQSSTHLPAEGSTLTLMVM